MASGLNKVLEHLHQALGPPGGDPADGQLLGWFAANRDEAAFAALVRRHGPMVLGTCRRVLGHAQDAEDAFQATFLLLAQKASAVRRDAVAGWLHGVARRVALEARSARARRQLRERQVDELPQPAVAAAEPQDWPPLLDRELARLRAEYRAAVVLCDLEGLSRKEAARRLGVPEGTLSSRLARGRALLARRLAKCGVTLSAAALAAVAREAQAAPAALASETVRVGLLVAAGQVAAVSTPVAGLTREVLKAMFLGKLKVVAATAVVLAALGAGGVAWQAGGRGAAQGAPQDNGRAVEAGKKDRTPAPAAPPVLRSYAVPNGDAEAIGRVLAEAFEATPGVRITAVGRSTLLVFAAPEDQEVISKQLMFGPNKPRQPIEEAEAAIKALREARDPRTRRRAAAALLSAARHLADQPEPGQPAPAAKVAPAAKTYSLEMRNKPWATVFEWLSDQTGKPVITPFKPTGTFTFVGPPGGKYTLPEVIDILNEALSSSATQRYELIDRGLTFTLIPADEMPDSSLLPEVPAAELERRGKTELVRVVLKLNNVSASDLAPDVRKLLGPFGQAVPLEKFNWLILTDKAGNLRRVVRMVQELEAQEAKKRGGRQE
jgi:RNA polymerase sigma factor (sigma-70 family)